MLKRLILTLAIVGIMSCSAMATIIPPGTPPVPPDVFSIPGSFTILADTGSTAWSFTTTSGTTSGTYEEAVIRDITGTAVCPSGGCLDFVLEVSNSGASVDTLERVTMSAFQGFLTDVGYITGTGSAAPDFVNRPLPGATVGFFFTTTGITPGSTADFLDIQTNATAFGAGNVSIIDSGSFTGRGYSAVTPEPGTLALFGSGLFGLAAILRRKLTRA